MHRREVGAALEELAAARAAEVVGREVLDEAGGRGARAEDLPQAMGADARGRLDPAVSRDATEHRPRRIAAQRQPARERGARLVALRRNVDRRPHRDVDRRSRYPRPVGRVEQRPSCRSRCRYRVSFSEFSTEIHGLIRTVDFPSLGRTRTSPARSLRSRSRNRSPSPARGVADANPRTRPCMLGAAEGFATWATAGSFFRPITAPLSLWRAARARAQTP